MRKSLRMVCLTLSFSLVFCVFSGCVTDSPKKCYKQVSGDLLRDTDLKDRKDTNFPNDTDQLITIEIICPEDLK